MSEIINGIHWIKLPITIENAGVKHVNIYLVKGEQGWLLVDAGWNTEDSFTTFNDYLIKNGISVKDIKQIVLTHVHPDHYGMAGRIKKLSGAAIMMHNIEQDFIRPRYMEMNELLNQTAEHLITNGVPQKEMVLLRDASLNVEQYVVPVMPDRLLHNDDTLTTVTFTFRVIWTPGHSSGHICLYEPEKKILFSGDHILPKITPNIGVHPHSIENPLRRYIESLKEIGKLDIELTLPGHDEPFKNLNERIDEIIKHHQQRNEEILEKIALQPKTAYQIAKEMTWGNKGGLKDLPSFHARMAVFETLSHLEMMTTGSRVDLLPRKGVNYWVKK